MAKEKNKPEKVIEEKIIKTEYSDEMKQSFIDYSMSVLTARAIPDIRDGFKPVHRRILVAMKEQGLTNDKKHRKSANVVGTVISTTHPHGDAAVYEAMVNLSHDFSLNAPLVDGMGNFGSIEGDPSASQRYTEARLQKYAEEVFLNDLSKDTVNYVPNFDNTREEPSVLPAKLPNVLINGTNGIAVGTTTSTPPHNLKEVARAYKAYIANKKISDEELLEYIKGPDFPTGGIVVNKSDLPEIYKTGQGRLRIRGKVEFEPATGRGGRDKLVITEIPYTMIGLGIEKFLTDVAELAKGKILPEIIDILNQTSASGVRLVLEIKQDADIERIKNILYKKTKLEDVLPVNMMYVVDGVPLTKSLKEVFSEFYRFNVEWNTRKYTAILKKQKEIIEIKAGLIKAIDVIDTIIEILRGSDNVKTAKDCLMGISSANVKFKTKTAEKEAKKLTFTEIQAQAILDMKLSRLVNLELDILEKEKSDAEKLAKRCEKLLSDKKEMTKVIVSEVDELETKYGKARRTQITDAETVAVDLNTVADINTYVAFDKLNYFKCYDEATYNRNTDAIIEGNKVISAKMSQTLFLFTDKGNVHQLKVADIPMCKARDRGTPADNISNYNSANETILAVFSDKELSAGKLLFMTENNTVKFVEGNEFITSRKTITSTKLAEGDIIIAILSANMHHLIVRTKKGFCARIKLDDIPAQKRNSGGVKCMALGEGDSLAHAYALSKDDKTVLINEREYPITKVRLVGRGSTGQKI